MKEAHVEDDEVLPTLRMDERHAEQIDWNSSWPRFWKFVDTNECPH
jgi:hypothetical protein